MPKTGSIEIMRALAERSGWMLVATGLVVLLGSAAVHASAAHTAAALLFGLGVVALRILGTTDMVVLSTPWANIVRFTDLVSLVVLAIATFGPLLIVARGGRPGWDIAVLAGIILVWWTVLDRLIAHRRRIVGALALMALAWFPVILFHPTDEQVGCAIEILTLSALTFSGWSIHRAIAETKGYYRVIDTPGQSEDA